MSWCTQFGVDADGTKTVGSLAAYVAECRCNVLVRPCAALPQKVRAQRVDAIEQQSRRACCARHQQTAELQQSGHSGLYSHVHIPLKSIVEAVLLRGSYLRHDV